MSAALVHPGIALAALCAALALAAALVYRVAGFARPWSVPSASARGAVQLTVVSLVLAAALQHLWSAAAVLLVMFVAASITAARRSRAGRSGLWLTAALAAGLAAVLPAMLLSGVVPLEGVAVIPVGGIILGNAMTSTSLAAKRGLDAVGHRAGEVEAALSLGLSERDSRMLVVADSAADALLPGLDQTRTVGLVTLPGAFVGVLLASGSAVQAGAVQILVLVGLLLAQTCAVALTMELVARGVVRR